MLLEKDSHADEGTTLGVCTSSPSSSYSGYGWFVMRAYNGEASALRQNRPCVVLSPSLFLYACPVFGAPCVFSPTYMTSLSRIRFAVLDAAPGCTYNNGSSGNSNSAYHPNDVITCILDFTEDKLSFEINGEAQSYPITGIKAHAPLYAAGCRACDCDAVVLSSGLQSCWMFPSIRDPSSRHSILCALHDVADIGCVFCDGLTGMLASAPTARIARSGS